jgi:tetratricopeptide (TPR) repeat protein
MRFGQSYKDFVRAQELNKDPQLTKQIEGELEFSRALLEKSLKQRGPDFTLDQLIEQEEHFQRGIKLMEAYRWQEAEEAFRASIAMSDCLPQPWGNVSGCLLMQERYDEAEEALKRALVIDPTYDLALQNLQLLPELRRDGPPPITEIRDPMKGRQGIKQSITFLKG